MTREEYKALRDRYRSLQPKPAKQPWILPLLIAAYLVPLAAVGLVVIIALMRHG